MSEQTKRYTAAVALTAGQFVNLYESEGAAYMRLADASSSRPADGFVGADVASGARGNVYFPGAINRNLSGLTVGTTYYLGEDGAVTATEPTDGSFRQELGRAIAARQLIFEPSVGDGLTPTIASQSEAEAGTNNTKMMTPLREKQARTKAAAVVKIGFAFAGSSPPSPGANTGEYGYCTSTGGSYTVKQIVYDNGTELVLTSGVVMFHNAVTVSGLSVGDSIYYFNAAGTPVLLATA